MNTPADRSYIMNARPKLFMYSQVSFRRDLKDKRAINITLSTNHYQGKDDQSERFLTLIFCPLT